MFTCFPSPTSRRPRRCVTTQPFPRLRWSATVDTPLQLTHERVDDLPLLLGFLIKLRFPQLLDQALEPHPLHQGLSQGWMLTIWVAYILSQADHRKSAVRDWADGLRHTLEAATGQAIRDVDFTDDRLTLVLQRLSDTETWNRL